jgi:hypothetical protein
MIDDLKYALHTKLAISVVEAGVALGLSRNGAYAAARRGEIPTLKFGNKLVVPTIHVRRMLGLEQEAA